MAAPTMPDFYLLSIAHRADGSLLWWGPKSCGYTIALDRAGRYTEEEARKIAHGNAGAVVAVQCEHADERAQRVVSVDFLDAFRSLARVCRNTSCDDPTEEGGTLCPKCTAGRDGPTHYPMADSPTETWCRKIIASGKARTYVEREPVGHYSDLQKPKPVCQTCRRKAWAHRVNFLKKHARDCENPYCEGCRS